MKRFIINCLLMALVAIAGLQVSHAVSIRGRHAAEDNNKVIKIVTGSSDIAQNLGADGDKNSVSEIVLKLVKEHFEERLEELDWTTDDITPEIYFGELNAHSDDLLALGIDLFDEFDNIDLSKVITVGDLISAVKSALA
ncbi:hypothetical protein C5167_035882 [Papaver somniferum]|uniref:uncharacterized protein LOC113344116 isoform X2 n=1 Tax=Papaver somniferum TaxID=3469 RepID=UPI000E6F6714|nr:uncharacterized protein LOC113344116 isoform X2 [Papaver somniferum]RZC93365.1 hypothetical protein C5167_035882 [Papaver somniferum]